MRGLFLLVLAVTITATGVFQNKLSFEVVSVRPCKPGELGGGARPTPGGQRYVANCGLVRSLVWISFLLQPDQVIGGPNWIDDQHFYVEGVAARPSTLSELKIMMQNGIIDRFRLQFHRETKDLDAYVLGIDKSGPKNLREDAQTNGSDVAIGQKLEGLHEKWTAKSAPMIFFAWRLGLKLDPPVIDQTGLRSGGYDFDLSFTNEIPSGHEAEFQGLDTSGPTISQALRSQLGLTLEARKAPVEVLVIDSVERPTEN